MRAKIKIAALAVILALTVCAVPTGAGAAPSYTAPYSVIRVGLYTCTADGSVAGRSFPWANLENVANLGGGYELGYFDENRSFVSLGVRITDTKEISVIMDRNMVYNADNSYTEGIGAITVGCAHILLDGAYDSYDAAWAVASQYAEGFVRYENGVFKVLVGNYSASENALADIAKIGGTVDIGTKYTLTVVKTGTNKILFEFDCGTSRDLAIHPLAPEGVKAQTWHRGYKYYGDFAFSRKTGWTITTVNYVNVEDYIKGVVCYEMSPDWPLEALKAQAIAARTFLMYNINKHRGMGFDVCNCIDCQAYHGTNGANANSDQAVDETRGQYLLYNGQLCDTPYAASNGGASENSENVWTATVPYLRGVKDPYEQDIVAQAWNYNWSVEYTRSELGQRLSKYGLSDIVHIDMTFTEMGNVYSITFRDVNGRSKTFKKEEARTALGFNSQRYTVNGLGPAGRSSLFVNEGAGLPEGLDSAYVVGGSGLVDMLPSGEVYAISGSGEIGRVSPMDTNMTGGVDANAQGKFIFSGSGNGHNVGMSQWGAYSMAKYHGKTCEEILTFYYTGTQIVTSGDVAY